MLLDRDGEVAAVDRALAPASGGPGRVVLIEGEAGIGKTELVRFAQQRARRARMRVREARGGPLEREFPFGVVRQLFEGVLAGMPRPSARALVSGAAAGAAAVVGADAPPAEGSSLDLAQVLHGLYWLCSNLADHSPLLLSVDDAHWADLESLRWLSYMSNRVADLPLLLVVAARAGEAPADRASLQAIASAPSATVLRPVALSEAASATLVRAMRGDETAPEFSRACHAAAGGNPFYLRELVAETQRQRIATVAEQAERVGALGPRTISSATLVRLARLPHPAVPLAKAVTILGLDAELRHAAALAGADVEQAEHAADALAEAGILESRRPLNFVHPVVAAAIHEDIPAGERSRAHARAADLLAAEDADAGVVASHLLLVEPAGDATVRERLERAAADALARGAPATAARFLRRAVQETPEPDARIELLVKLGRTELPAGQPTALDSLSEAVGRTSDPDLLVEATVLLGNALFFAARADDADEVARQTIERLDRPPEDPLVLKLEALRVQMTAFDSRFAAEVAERLPRLFEQAEWAGAGARVIFVVGGMWAAIGVDRCDEVPALIERGLVGDRLTWQSTADSVTAGQAVCALAFVDELARAESLLDALFASARDRNSVLTYVTALVWRGWTSLRRGQVPVAVADQRAALALCHQHGLLFPLLWAQAFLAGALLEAGELEEAEAVVDSMEFERVRLDALQGMALDVRGRVRLARGDHEGGTNDLATAGERHKAIGHINPNATHWGSTLALALGRDSPEALPLVEEELALARRAGCARALGVALRAEGLLRGGDEGIARLNEAAAVLDDTPARLEHARTLSWLGGELRRQGRRAEAREPLRRALDVADRLGAERLAGEAQMELAAAGGRARRRRLSGVEALTPTERRVAEMAADGLRNKAIAQTLFVSRKTVEMHLGNAYRKLDIHARDQLAGALDPGEDSG